ncbi:MAG: glycosyltransferase family 2 protein [Dorea sp.]|nr:glycosyltransferase family 2 protein [Dorea sp.]
MDKISVVIPCWNEEEALPIYYKEMNRVMESMNQKTEKVALDFELIFVDDGSLDGTLRIMKELNQKDTRCRYLSFSRNFGKEAAIYAGLKAAEGNYVAVMDVDLQDPPALLPDMYHILREGYYDSVATKRSTRTGEPRIRSFLSERFYRFVNRISKTEIVNGARDYRLMNRKMVDAVLEMSEYNRFSKGIFGWVGFRTKWLEFENVERSAGETKWSLKKLFCYSLEGITGFSVAPLSLAAIVGVLFCGLSFLLIVVIIVRTLVWGDPVSGWPSLACIIFMVSGVQLLCTGIVGQYLSKTYLETKHRPIFILRDSSEDGERN